MKKKLTFRFHDPNPAGIAAEYILKELVAANMSKAERAYKGSADEGNRFEKQK